MAVLEHRPQAWRPFVWPTKAYARAPRLETRISRGWLREIRLYCGAARRYAFLWRSDPAPASKPPSAAPGQVAGLEALFGAASVTLDSRSNVRQRAKIKRAIFQRQFAGNRCRFLPFLAMTQCIGRQLVRFPPPAGATKACVRSARVERRISSMQLLEIRHSCRAALHLRPCCGDSSSARSPI